MSTFALVLGLALAATNETAVTEEGTATAPTPQSVRGPERAGVTADRLTFFGFGTLGFSYVTPPTQGQLVGSNNGFRLASVRLGARIKPAEQLDVVTSLDAGVMRRSETDALSGARIVELRDAFARWSPRASFSIRGGQFKPPFNGEALLPDNLVPFVSRSILSRGILPPDGLPQEGLSVDRQVGVEVSSNRLGEKVGFRYALGLFNGNGANVLFNDNNSFMPAGRVSIDFGDTVNLGLAGLYNPQMLGVRPNQITEEQLGWNADLSFTVGGLNVMGVVLGRRTFYSTTQLPPDRALGWMGSVRYLHEASGFDVGVRLARLEPSVAQRSDMQGELTAMVGYWFQRVPIRVVAQYSLRREEPSVAIQNNAVDAMAQVYF